MIVVPRVLYAVDILKILDILYLIPCILIWRIKYVEIKRFLLVLVVGYSVYQVYWGTGWNEQNLFLLICSLIAFCLFCFCKNGSFC